MIFFYGDKNNINRHNWAHKYWKYLMGENAKIQNDEIKCVLMNNVLHHIGGVCKMKSLDAF